MNGNLSCWCNSHLNVPNSSTPNPFCLMQAFENTGLTSKIPVRYNKLCNIRSCHLKITINLVKLVHCRPAYQWWIPHSHRDLWLTHSTLCYGKVNYANSGINAAQLIFSHVYMYVCRLGGWVPFASKCLRPDKHNWVTPTTAHIPGITGAPN